MWIAGVGSTLPEVSTARTSNVCVPTRRISLYGLCAAPCQSRVCATLSSRHWNVTLLALSVPLKRNVATSSWSSPAAPATSDVFGGIEVGRARTSPSQRTLKHCSGLSVIGSSGPRLPWPVLPPPSMLTRPLLPSLTQMPQVPLSLAMLSLIVVADLGHEDAVALVVVRAGCPRSACRSRRRPRRRRRCRSPSLWLEMLRSEHVVEREVRDLDAGALGLAGVVVLDPVVARVVQRDAALVRADVVAAHERVARVVRA